MESFASAHDLLSKRNIECPVRCLRPHALKAAATSFLGQFDGLVLYAVKANDALHVLTGLFAAGIRHFDVASIGECEKLRGFPNAQLYLMNPVKSRSLIRRAYFEFGVRDFSLDTLDELGKIRQETDNANDLALHVRLLVSNHQSFVPLEGKFGIEPEQAVRLLRQCRNAGQKLGLCFHVGSQAMQPARFAEAIFLADQVAKKADVNVDVLDVGGGFPGLYQGLEPKPLAVYMNEISHAVSKTRFARNAVIMAEPGRALVASSESLLVQVIGRKDRHLYIDDGVYGHLLEGAAGYSGLAYPTKLVRPNGESREHPAPFALFGPTCDSFDYLPGPFMLPEDMREGDYIEIFNTGAYGRVSASGFNGFNCYGDVILRDDPMALSCENVSQSQRETVRA